MDQVYGKEAIVALAEIDTGHRKATEQEYRYVKRQAKSFARWLIEQGNTVEQASAICNSIYRRTKDLLERSTFDEFVWSRQGDVSESDIDVLSKFEENINFRIDEEFMSFQLLWKDINDEKSIPKTNKVGFMGYTPDHWKRIQERIAPIEHLLDYYEDFTESFELDEKQRQSLINLREYVRKLRFGVATGTKHNKVILSAHRDGIYISNTIWKKLTNRINRLLGEGKIYDLPELENSFNPDDAMDNNPVYGFDFERY